MSFTTFIANWWGLILVGVLLCLAALGALYVLLLALRVLAQFELNASQRFDHHFLSGRPLFLALVLPGVAVYAKWATVRAGPFGALLMGACICLGSIMLLRNFRRTPVHFALVGSLLQAGIAAVVLWRVESLVLVGAYFYALAYVRTPVVRVMR